MWTLENDRLRLTISETGAEPQSIQRLSDGYEYLWQGDPVFWEERAPLLFPFCGRVKNSRILLDGRIYANQSIHGFIRMQTFTLKEKTRTSLVLSHQSDEKTRALYPFDYTITVSYTLDGPSVKIGYRVTNPSKEETLPYSIGFHPGFNIPLEDGLDFSDYRLDFGKEKKPVYTVPLENHILVRTDRFERCPLREDRYFDLTREAFLRDIFFENPSEYVTLRSDKGAHSITVQSSGLPFLGVWQPEENLPGFICLEPWQGLPDTSGPETDFRDKPFLDQLAPASSRDYRIVLSFT